MYVSCMYVQCERNTAIYRRDSFTYVYVHTEVDGSNDGCAEHTFEDDSERRCHATEGSLHVLEQTTPRIPDVYVFRRGGRSVRREEV